MAYTKIQQNVYYVTTQAAFRDALKNYIQEEIQHGISGVDKSAWLRTVDCHPIGYPALLTVTIGYRGHSYLQCSIVQGHNLGNLREALTAKA